MLIPLLFLLAADVVPELPGCQTQPGAPRDHRQWRCDRALSVDVELRYGFKADVAHNMAAQGARSLAAVGGFDVVVDDRRARVGDADIKVTAATIRAPADPKFVAFHLYANHRRRDGVLVGARCEVERAADVAAAEARCLPLWKRLFFGSARLPDNVARRAEALDALDPLRAQSGDAAVQCSTTGCDTIGLSWEQGKADALAARAGGAPTTTCLALGVSARCATVGSGLSRSVVALDDDGLLLSCTTGHSRCLALFIPSDVVVKTLGGGGPAMGDVSGASGIQGPDSLNGLTVGDLGQLQATPKPTTTRKPQPGSSLVVWDKAYESDHHVAADYASESLRRAYWARDTKPAEAIALARVATHLNPQLDEARKLDDDLSVRRPWVPIGMAAGGAAVVVVGTLGAAAVIASGEEQTNGFGVLLFCAGLGAGGYLLISGSLDASHELFKPIDPQLPPELAHRRDWVPPTPATP